MANMDHRYKFKAKAAVTAVSRPGLEKLNMYTCFISLVFQHLDLFRGDSG